MSPRVAIVTNFPSYHQVELFNQLALSVDIHCKVFYLRHLPPDRHWTKLRQIKHEHSFIREYRLTNSIYLNPSLMYALKDYAPDLLVVTQYASVAMQTIMYQWSASRKPWVFWSEAPGVQWSETPIISNAVLRHLMRSVALLPLRLGPAELWAIGHRAMEIYKNVTRSPVYNVPYYFDVERFSAPTRSSFSSPVRLLYAGKFNVRKGFDVLIDSIIQLAHQADNFQLRLVGTGPLLHLLDNLPEKARSKVDYVGFAEIDDMPTHYQWADILLFPSRYDGWGMGVHEGMAAGLVTVSTISTGSANDSIKSGVNGFIVPSGDVTALANVLSNLILTSNSVAEMGEKARTSVRKYHITNGASVIKQRILGILDESKT